MNKKLLTLALCAFLNVSVWASESDDEFDLELAGINNEKNMKELAALTERLSRCSTGFKSASLNENNGAARAASRAQSSANPDKQLQELHKEIAHEKNERKRLGSITNIGMAAMDTREQKNSERRKSESQENNISEVDGKNSAFDPIVKRTNEGIYE